MSIEEFENAEFGIKVALVRGWLHKIYEESGKCTDLENAITICKIISEEVQEVAVIVATLYRLECGGQLHPPVSILKLYAEVCS